MVKTSTLFLLHIRDAIDLITSYIGDMTFDKFKDDNKTRDAVIRQIILKFPGEKSPIFVMFWHKYWDVDLEILWKAATIDIKELKQSLTSIIERRTRS